MAGSVTTTSPAAARYRPVPPTVAIRFAGASVTSLDDIGHHADVARATVYHQVGSRLGVLEAGVDDLERRAGLPALAEPIELTPAERLVPAVLRAGCGYWATDPPLVRTIMALAETRRVRRP